MREICKFNPASDIEEVIPDLAPDISEMMVTHTVPATSAVDSPYSNETDITKVGHYLRDKIDIAMAQYRLNQKIAADSASSAASAAASTGSTFGEKS